MGEGINGLVAFAVIVFLIRWATSRGGGNTETRRARDLLGFQPKNVTQEMISTVQSMFPDIPRDNIHYDLLRTGNVQVTSNKLIERGYLEPPPQAFFQLFPTQPAPTTAPPSTGQTPTAASSSSTSAHPSKTNLISRFKLEERLRSEEDVAMTEGDAGGKAAWEDTAERREASLRERKAQMVLAARKRFLEQPQQTSSGSASYLAC